MKNNKTQLKNWRTVKLGDIVTLHRGYDLPVDKIKKGEFPVVFSNGKIEQHNEFKIKGPGVITGRSGTLGNTFYVRKNYWPHNTTLYVSDFHGNYPKFIYFLLKRLNLSNLNAGSGVPTLNRNHVHQVLVDMPSSPNEQKRIADVLSAFDDKIELNNKINQNLEQTAQTIFKEWFGRKEKNGKISDLIDIISGFPFSSKIYSKDGLGVVTIKNVQDGNFIRNFDSFIKRENLPNKLNSYCFLKKGDILLSLTGNVGRICFVYGGEYLLNQRVVKLQPKNKKDLALCYFLFRQPSMQNHLINMAKGSAQPNLSPVETGEIKIPVCRRDILDKFNDAVDPIYQIILNNSEENQKLAALRDLLLPKLMSGEIRV